MGGSATASRTVATEDHKPCCSTRHGPMMAGRTYAHAAFRALSCRIQEVPQNARWSPAAARRVRPADTVGALPFPYLRQRPDDAPAKERFGPGAASRQCCGALTNGGLDRCLRGRLALPDGWLGRTRVKQQRGGGGGRLAQRPFHSSLAAGISVV